MTERQARRIANDITGSTSEEIASAFATLSNGLRAWNHTNRRLAKVLGAKLTARN